MNVCEKIREEVQWWEEKECQLFPTGAALQKDDLDPSVRMDRIRILHVRMN